MGRPQAKGQHAVNSGSKQSKPFWQTAFVGVTHCGSGCTLGDILAEWTVFFSALPSQG